VSLPRAGGTPRQVALNGVEKPCEKKTRGEKTPRDENELRQNQGEPGRTAGRGNGNLDQLM